jgi:hypothetical protein
MLHQYVLSCFVLRWSVRAGLVGVIVPCYRHDALKFRASHRYACVCHHAVVDGEVRLALQKVASKFRPYKLTRTVISPISHSFPYRDIWRDKPSTKVIELWISYNRTVNGD